MIDVRDTRTRGVTRARLRQEARRSLRPLLVLALGVAILLPAAGWVVSRVSETFLRDTVPIRFEVANTFGIFEGADEVRFRGVPAGTITKIEREGTQLVLTGEIQRKYMPIHRDATAQIRSVTPLNDTYLDIVDAGTPAAGVASEKKPIAQARTTSLVTVPDVLDALQSNERRALHALLADLGNGLEDRGASLRRAFAELVPFLERTGELTSQVAARRAATTRLVANASRLTEELGRREDMLRRLVSTGAATLGTLQGRAPRLDATLAELAPTMRELQASLRAVSAVAGDVDRGLESLDPVADELGDSLASVRRLEAALRPAVAELREPVERLVPLARTLDPLASGLRDTSTGLAPQVDTIARLTQRLVDCEKGIQNFFQWNASLTKFGDSNAPIPRGNLAFGIPDAGLPGAAKRQPPPSCAPGRAIDGRPSVPGDEE
jgi:virulence factor Mce-like protein